jgi:hypothetical protein
LFAIITVAALVNLAGELGDRPGDDNLIKVINELLWHLIVVVFAFLAALILSQKERNVIGWLMMLPAFLFVAEVITVHILQQFPVAPAEPTVALMLAVWFNNLSWQLLIFPLLFTMLLFPDGRPLSPRWRWVPLFGLGMIAFSLFVVVFSATLTLIENEDWVVANPIGFLPPLTELPLLIVGASLALIALILLCLAAPFVRYRRSVGVERKQIKWLFYACGLFVIVFVPGLVISDLAGTLLNDVWSVLYVLAIMAVPVAIAVAVLRYRLYDIDVIIRKTLVYAVLTGLLAMVYLGSVVLLQAVFETITGQRSPVVIVISTLLIAALFAPLRRRVQTAIDQRFFRQKYDAQRVLSQFAQTARDEVDLETLTAELVRVTRETVQPESVSIWLKR